VKIFADCIHNRRNGEGFHGIFAVLQEFWIVHFIPPLKKIGIGKPQTHDEGRVKVLLDIQ
jgi:hypothetical protein